MQEYLTQDDGETIIRPELKERFFTDLHETLRAQLFGGSDMRMEETADGNVEITLPPPSHLPDVLRLQMRDGYFRITSKTMRSARRYNVPKDTAEAFGRRNFASLVIQSAKFLNRIVFVVRL